MRILIIDSEEQAIKHIEKLIKQVAPEKKIVGRCSSIKEATRWFSLNPVPDLVFSAVQLQDGLSFDLFRRLHKNVPVIFTCYHDKYAIDAFKVNGIHYLTKPVGKKEIGEALGKYETIFSPRRDLTSREAHPMNGHSSYQERFIVQVGKQLKLVPAEEIAYFYTENKIIYLVTNAGEKYTIDFTLEHVENLLNPKLFFRINRQFITNISSIVKIMPASKSRLELKLKPETRHGIITSFDRTANFRKWLMGIY